MKVIFRKFNIFLGFWKLEERKRGGSNIEWYLEIKFYFLIFFGMRVCGDEFVIDKLLFKKKYLYYNYC